MNRRPVIAIIMVLIVGLFAVGVVLAQQTLSFNWWIVASGGAPSSGGEITLNDTLGQPLVGAASSEDVQLNAGYWRSIAAPIAISDLLSTADGGALRLGWPAVRHDTDGNRISDVTYSVYRAQDTPYFTPDVAYEKGLTNPTYTDPDPNVIGNTAHSTFYVVTAVSAGLESTISNRVGTFAFPLTPGS